MIRFRALQAGLFYAFTVALLVSCEKAPDGSPRFTGQPKIENKWVAPTEITDFTQLYRRNCLGCHSNSSDTVSAAIAMDNETYLSIVPEDVLHNIIANGIPRSLMPGFSIKAGGQLTDEQIDILVKGILAKKPTILATDIPAYSAAAGDPTNGKLLFEASIYGKEADLNRSFLNPAFLGMVSDQYLRTLLIIGLPKLGYPDFRNLVPGKALTTTEISDLTAWIVSNRKNEFGQPLVAPAPAPAPAPTPAAPAVLAAPPAETLP